MASLFNIADSYDAVYKWFHYLKLSNHFITGYVIAVEGAYRPQASQYYLSNTAMNDYLEVKFQPIVKPEPKKEATQPSQPVEIKLTLDAANGWQPTVSKM